MPRPLAFDGIRPSYPGIPVQGAVSGPHRAARHDRAASTGSRVSGELGDARVQGHHRPRLRARSRPRASRARFTGLDLARLRGTGPDTSLTGALERRRRPSTPPTGPTGGWRWTSSRSRIGELTLDTLRARARAADGALRLDTLEAGWPGGGLAAAGRLRWREPSEPADPR